MKEEYIKRVNQVLEYIEDNLHADLTLKSIAKIAFYSPFHLHRLFKAITNESLNSYIIRKRIEKAAIQLVYKKDLTISEIGHMNGFNSNSSFTRTFGKKYDQSPTNFRKSYSTHFSKIGKINSKNGKVNFITEEYLCNINSLKNWIKMNAKIEIKQMPKMKLAYITHIGVENLENAFERILRWARSKNVLSEDDSTIVRIFHDSFKFTDDDKVRMSICITVGENVQAEGEVGITMIESGKCIVGYFEIEPQQFEKSWNSLFIWMNEMGYKKAERNPYEIYYNNFQEHPEKKCFVDLCIPIECQ